MYAYATHTTQPERVASGAFACGIHLLFFALLVFGVNWQRKVEPQVNVVDLWTTVQPQAQPQPAPPPPEVKPEVPPKVEPPPPAKTEVKPEIAKPDIAIKDKAEKERRVQEVKPKEAKKREDDAKASEAKQQAEAQRQAREQEQAQQQIAAQQAASQARLKNEYVERIRAKIKRFVVLPPNLQGNPESEFDVVLLPGGEVLGAKLKRGSGNAAYDNAVERAILKAQPLPLPPDPAMFKDFRELNLRFRPQE